MPELQFTCDHCGMPIDPDEGSLFITNDEIQTAMTRIEALSNGVGKTPTGGSVLEIMEAVMRQPRVGEYKHMHEECITAAGLEPTYTITLDRLNTYGHLLAWSRHLREKAWQEGSNFNSIMDRAAPELPM